MLFLACGDLAPERPLRPSRADTAVWHSLRSADLATVNLEVPLTRRAAPADKAIALRADPDVAASLREAGVALATVANNHALDYGPSGLADTLGALGKAGIVAVGGGADLEEAMRAAVLTVSGVTVAVLGFACTLPPGFAAAAQRPGIAPIRVRARFHVDAVTLDEQPGMAPWVETQAVPGDVARACEAVARAREQASSVAVHLHWGVPNGWCAAFQGLLADYQRPLGHALVDAGADLVIGHHPHVVHGVERRGRGAIVYSLGNFLFHSMAKERKAERAAGYPPYLLASLQEGEAREGVVLEAEVEEDGLRTLRFRPIRLDDEGEPELLRGDEADAVLARLQARSAEVGTAVELAAGGAVSLAEREMRAGTRG